MRNEEIRRKPDLLGMHAFFILWSIWHKPEACLSTIASFGCQDFQRTAKPAEEFVYHNSFSDGGFNNFI